MQNNERAAFQQVDVPVSVFSAQLLNIPLSKNPLMVLVNTLGRSFQLIFSSENALTAFLGKRLWRAKVLDKTWSVDDSAQTGRVALDAGPDSCELIFSRAPGTGSEDTFAARLNYHTIVSV